MSRSPYLQGDLGALCGVYSVVNAAKLVHEDFRGDKAWELFSRCLKEIEKRKPLSRLFEGGMKARDLKALLREVLARLSGFSSLEKNFGAGSYVFSRAGMSVKA